MDLKNKFCPKPFEYLDIHFVEGEFRCYVCCPTWLPVSVGDIGKGGLEAVWNGDLIKEIRKSMLNSSFLYCDKSLCPEIQAGTLHHKDYIYKSDYKEYLNYEDGQVPHGPKIVYFSEDRTCNLACPSCRKDYITLNDDLFDHLKGTRDKFLPDLMKDVENLNICSSGDPFSSRLYREFLFQFEGDQYPKLKINLNTNGVLLTPEVFQKMSGIHRNLSQIFISIDAAKEESYNIVRKGGQWQKLLDNISGLVQFRKKGLIDHLQLDFVVQDHNYREMPAFVKLGRSLGVDKVYFQRISNWGTFNDQEFAKRDVLSPSHPQHLHFLDVCRHPLMRDKIVKKGNLSSFIPKAQREKFYQFLKSFKFLRRMRKRVLEISR
ncbi:MAG: hypothetical protein K9K67_09855 [Bacteriovoracaceae bacterium]|nr:hypothetical protein [Bacteriovoracaceae bacterium]